MLCRTVKYCSFLATLVASAEKCSARALPINLAKMSCFESQRLRVKINALWVELRMRRMRVAVSGLLFLLSAATCLGADVGSNLLIVASGTKMRAAITERTKLRRGAAVRGRLPEPIYVNSQLAVPAGATLEGSIVSVLPAQHSKRLEAKFRGDFTPLGEPVIQFTSLILHDGEHFPIAASVSGTAGTTLYFQTAPPKNKSIFGRAWDGLVGRKNSAITPFAA